MTYPIALIDVDGVINSYAPDYIDRFPDVIPDVEIEEVEGTVLSLVLGIRDRLQVLDDNFECVWATMWEDSAVSILAPILGVGADWDYLTFPDAELRPISGMKGETYKLPIVKRWVEQNADYRRVVWIDDDLESDAHAWARGRNYTSYNSTLLLPTNMFRGFTDEDLDHVLQWSALRRAS